MVNRNRTGTEQTRADNAEEKQKKGTSRIRSGCGRISDGQIGTVWLHSGVTSSSVEWTVDKSLLRVTYY